MDLTIVWRSSRFLPAHYLIRSNSHWIVEQCLYFCWGKSRFWIQKNEWKRYELPENLRFMQTISYLKNRECYQVASRNVERVFGHLRGRHQDAKTRMCPGTECEIDNARCCWCVYATARSEHHGNLQPARVSQCGARIETHVLATQHAQVGRGRLGSGESLIR